MEQVFPVISGFYFYSFCSPCTGSGAVMHPDLFVDFGAL